MLLNISKWVGVDNERCKNKAGIIGELMLHRVTEISVYLPFENIKMFCCFSGSSWAMVTVSSVLLVLSVVLVTLSSILLQMQSPNVNS